jgi:ATP-dependent DNA helicase RecQ
MEAGKKVQEHHMHLLELMRRYVTGNVCRQYQLGQYFTRENLVIEIPHDEEEIAQFCGVCDNCFARDEKLAKTGGVAVAEEKVEIYREAKMMVDLVRTLSTNYGFKNLVGILAGSKAKDFPARLKHCTYYSRGDSKSQVFWRALGDTLIDHGYLKYTKVGGLYGGSKWGKKSSKVFQVVTVGPKKFAGESLKIVPSDSLKKAMRGSEPNNTNDVGTTGKTGELMSELKKFRTEVSVKMNLPPYMVMGDKVINNLLGERLPTDISRLALVDGINTHVIMMYGDDLVGVMNKCAPVNNTTKNTSSACKIIKGCLNSSQKETVDLYKQGLGVKEIAEKRDMVGSTIENHLMKAFALEDGLDSSRLVTDDQKGKIEDYLRDNKDKKLKEIKDGLKDKGVIASYMEIKIVIALMSKEEGKNEEK